MPLPEPGLEPGLRFALAIDSSGHARPLDWAGIAAWTPGDEFLWIHLEQDSPQTEAWLRAKSGIPPIAIDSLLSDDARPRVVDFDDSLMMAFRGVNVCAEHADAELVPIHLWAESTKVVSLRHGTHQLMALREIREAYENGRGPRNPAHLVAIITEKLVDHVELVIDDLEEQLADLEMLALGKAIVPNWRLKLGTLRRWSTALRRFIAPQRDALYRLQHDDASWLTPQSLMRLREVSDKIIRHLEDIDAVRDRAAILHEDLTAQISERIALTSNRLAAIAAILLPPGIICGLLGMNVEGIPYKDAPWAFAAVCLICVTMMPMVYWAFKRLKWLD